MAQTCSDTISHLTLVSWNPLRPEAIAGTVRSAFSVGSPPSSDGNPANRRKKKKPFEKDWTHTECLISESYEEVESVAIVAPLLASVNPLVQRPRKICVRQIHVNLHLYVQESNLRPSEVQRHQWWCICHHLEIRWWSKNLWEVFNPLHANAIRGNSGVSSYPSKRQCWSPFKQGDKGDRNDECFQEATCSRLVAIPIGNEDSRF